MTNAISRLRFSIREFLILTALVALSATLLMQRWRYHQTELHYQKELAILRNRLYSTQQILSELPATDPERAYVLATPSFAYARWAWRVYLPPGRRYTLRVDVGHLGEKGMTRHISTAHGRSHHMSALGSGETVVVVERLPSGKHTLLGVSFGKQDTNCRLTSEVSRCMADRYPYQEEQLGAAGAEDVARGQPINLLMRWYPSADTFADGQPTPGPAGFSVWLEPF